MLYPLVALATMATTIASQALITGVFSISMQAVQLGYLPRLHIEHTSDKEFGQIFIKSINYALMVGCIFLVLTFRTSSNLASAYGLAVTGTMIITTILFYLVAIHRWHWKRIPTLLICSVFGVIDLAFLGSNFLKFFSGGWFPLLLGVLGMLLMTTWKTGRQILGLRLKEKSFPLNEFLLKLKTENVHRSEGVGVFMNRGLANTPLALVQTYAHFNAVHRHLIFVSVEIKGKPRLGNADRYELYTFQESCYFLKIYYGYLEQPNIPAVFDMVKATNPLFDKDKASFFIGRENIFATDIPGMLLWRERLFSFLSKNELPATQYFRLPKDRVLEVGTQVAI